MPGNDVTQLRSWRAVAIVVVVLYTHVSNIPNLILCTCASNKGSLFSAAVFIVKLIPGSVVLSI